MHWIALAIAAYVAAVIELSFADLLAINGVAPDLLALTLVAWRLVARAGQQVAAFMIGLIADLITPVQPGIGVASLLVMGWLTAYCTRALPGNLLWGVPVVLLAVSVGTLLSAGARQLLGETDLPLLALLLKSLGVGVYTAACAIPVLMVLSWIRQPTPSLQGA
jgi:rod shape-determining protein MreD